MLIEVCILLFNISLYRFSVAFEICYFQFEIYMICQCLSFLKPNT